MSVKAQPCLACGGSGVDDRTFALDDCTVCNGTGGVVPPAGVPVVKELQPEQFDAVIKSMPSQPWGIGSRKLDALNLARAVWALACGVPVPAADYLAKVEADPKRAAALQRARDRAGVAMGATWEHKCARRPRSAPMTVLPAGEPCPACGVNGARTPLTIWREICEEAPACVNDGRKYLMVNESACVDLGTALENAHGVAVPDGGQNHGC